MSWSLDNEVRRHDEDRWLASRFAPANVREALVALYALNHEASRCAAVVSNEQLGLIRLAWWRDAAAAACEGRMPDANPILTAFAQVAQRASFGREAVTGLVEGYASQLSNTPFETWNDAEAFLAETEAPLMRLALGACETTMSEAFVSAAARACGLLRLARAGKLSTWPTAEALERVRAARDSARDAAAVLPPAAFPACGHLALIDLQCRSLARGRGTPALLSRQIRLVGAAATGRL